MSKSVPVLNAQEVASLIAHVDAVGEMRRAFAALASGLAVQPPQTLALFPNGAGDFITYLGVLAEAKVFGAKLSPYIAQPTGGLVTAWTVLMSMETGEPVLLCDSKQLTTERTAATTALAVDLLAPREASRLAIIGTGAAGRAHLRHVLPLRAWSEVRVYSRGLAGDTDRCRALASVDPRVLTGSDLGRATRGADVVLLCTSSGTPVLDPATLDRPALITSISTNAPRAHEVPPASLGTMDVFCDYKATTAAAAGEMAIAAAEHGWSPSAVVGDLADLVAGRISPPSYRRHAYFRSIGLGLEDVAMANALLQVAAG
ncbi:MAG TPA: ornithine cyclodeaminase family protein [Steroidobacteraceae bacterium]|nr:ornithine cyclodeaminase family protein [Steroidobacteraceae bacterium]